LHTILSQIVECGGCSSISGHTTLPGSHQNSLQQSQANKLFLFTGAEDWSPEELDVGVSVCMYVCMYVCMFVF
jgi:hypothetical protein